MGVLFFLNVMTLEITELFIFELNMNQNLKASKMYGYSVMLGVKLELFVLWTRIACSYVCNNGINMVMSIFRIVWEGKGTAIIFQFWRGAWYTQ